MSKGKLTAIIACAAVIVVVIVIVVPRLATAAGQISSWYDLDAIRQDLTGDYRLIRHLDANSEGYAEVAGPNANGGRGWQPIGTYAHQFTGTFDGRGYTIEDLFIDRPGEDGVGLFGSVDDGASISNVGVIDANMIGRDGLGGLVGDNWGGNVTNSYTSGTVTGKAYVGGLVGWNVATVSHCHSECSVTATDSVDGSVGGLVGASAGNITNSYSSGSATGITVVGGLVGDNIKGAVSHSFSSATVTGDDRVGGLVGFNDGSTYSCYWDKEISGIDVSDGGTGKTTTEMMSIATFIGTETGGLDEPWDITTVAPGATDRSFAWNIVDGETYPFLSWQSS